MELILTSEEDIHISPHNCKCSGRCSG